MDNVLNRLKNTVNKAKDFIKDEILTEDPLLILPYRGYANENNLWLKGRVLEDENVFEGKSDSQIRNLLDSFKRFETDELADEIIRVKINGKSIETETDEEGYFTFDIPWSPVSRADENRWVKVEVEMGQADMPLLKKEGEIFVPAADAQYGIITDMDDTILQTHVTSLFRLKMLYSTFLQDAHQRLPMEGMVDLFRDMVIGEDGKRENPTFYVSNSPWNIYDILEEFLSLQNLPKGPLLLRDYGLVLNDQFSNHKMNSIGRILRTYPNLPFVLLGDTASKDADHYIDLAREFPGQVEAVYIRQTKDNKNARRVAKLIEANTNINVVLVHSSADIRKHAQQIGLIAK